MRPATRAYCCETGSVDGCQRDIHCKRDAIPRSPTRFHCEPDAFGNNYVTFCTLPYLQLSARFAYTFCSLLPYLVSF